MAQACGSITWEDTAQGSKVHGQLQLHTEFQTSLGYTGLTKRKRMEKEGRVGRIEQEGREGQKERTISSIPQSHSASSGPFRHATTSLCCNSVLLKLKISFDLCDLQNP